MRSVAFELITFVVLLAIQRGLNHSGAGFSGKEAVKLVSVCLV